MKPSSALILGPPCSIRSHDACSPTTRPASPQRQDYSQTSKTPSFHRSHPEPSPPRIAQPLHCHHLLGLVWVGRYRMRLRRRLVLRSGRRSACLCSACCCLLVHDLVHGNLVRSLPQRERDGWRKVGGRGKEPKDFAYKKRTRKGVWSREKSKSQQKVVASHLDIELRSPAHLTSRPGQEAEGI